MAAAYVKNCGKVLAGSRTAMPVAGLRIVREHKVGAMEVIV
jgi:hypothetical protein